MNFIFNDGNKNQTADLSATQAGYYWYQDGKLINSNYVPGTEPTDPVSSSSSKEESTYSVESSSASSSSSSSSTASSSTASSSSSAASSSTAASSTSKDETPLPEIDYIKVFCPNYYNNIYAWVVKNGTPEPLLGAWPGSSKALVAYGDSWKTYDFASDIKNVNFIFNTNGDTLKTADLSASAPGYYWYTGSKLVNTNIEPEIEEGGSGEWHGQAGNIYKDPEGYEKPTTLPDPTYTEVASASDYTQLPAVANYNGKVVNKYSGSRTDFRDESIYFAITTRFYDGDASNNTHCWDSKNDASSDPNWRGDFKGLIEKMDYIKALGFTAIWITPVVKNASGFDYHGYHAINFNEVDPRYESEDVAFQDVINEAHKRDMKIVLDVVFNHTCNFGEENLFPMFYYDSANNTTLNGLVRYKNGLLPDNYESLNNPGEARFTAMKEAQNDVNNIYHHKEHQLAWEQYTEQTGQIAGDCVDLNTENPTVANYLVAAYTKFIEMGVDAFRIDTMKHISRLTLNKYFFPAFKANAKKCRGDDNFHMFGEVCVKDNDVWNRGQQSDSVPFYTWAETKSFAWGNRATNEASTLEHWNYYLQPTNALKSPNNAYLNPGLTYHTPDHSKSSGNSVIDFPMHWNFDNARNAFGVAVNNNNDNVYNDATYNVVYVDSHDYGPNEQQTVRFNRGTNAWKENMALMFTFRGVPCLYYGSEIQFKAGKTIDKGPELALENSGRAYFGDSIDGDVTATGFGTYTGATGSLASTLNSTLSQHLQKLNKARLSCLALRRGQYTTSNVSGDAMAFTRRYTANGVDSIACVAISGSANFTGLPNGTYKDLYSGVTATVSNGTLRASASGQGNVAIYVKQ